MSLKRIFLLVFILIVAAGGYLGWMLFGPRLNSPEGGFFYIHTGTNYQQVKNDLISEGIISNVFWLDKVSDYANYPERVKPGRYKIGKSISLVNLVRMLKAGRQDPVNLVITKLRTPEDLAKKISNSLEPDSTQVINFLKSNDSLFQFGVDTNTLMTLVIPNTYEYNWNTGTEEVLKKLSRADEKFWNEERSKRAAGLHLTPKEVYTLASIVEEESNKPDDKGKIASVYVNRIRRGMRLAADPTVKFAMKNFGLKRIYHRHLAYVSPFNTYMNAGLPPGPICTPSIKTIDAVLNMPETDYLFFVARSDFSGYSDFATTYTEHLIYAKAYQKALDSLIRKRQQQK